MSLTRERILLLPACRALDLLVAEKVMGQVWQGGNPIPNYTGVGGCWPHPFSTSIEAAWEVVEKLDEKNYQALVRRERSPQGSYWRACFFFPAGDGSWIGHAEADTAALAICRAALLTTLEKT